MTEEYVIGKKYGEWTVIEELDPHITPNGSKKRMVKARCSCGNIIVSQLPVIKNSKMCRSCAAKSRRVDITGKRFGKLVVTSMAADYVSPSGNRLSQCNCVCDCGNTIVVAMCQLVTGSTKSCGCLDNTRELLKDNPELVKKYDFKKNEECGIDFETITAHSNKKVWWKCFVCGRSWFATVASQNDKIKHGCPYCSGRFVVEGKTDLLSQFPEIAKEWDYDRNKLRPNEVTKSSSVKYWWKCSECGYVWKQTVANRTSRKTGCPKCNIENVNSFCEQAVFYYIKQAFNDAINGDMHIGMELDIFIPSKNTAIEYDGDAWHKSEKKVNIDIRKNDLCKEKGITLIRIREPNLSPIDNCITFTRSDSITNKSLDNVICELLNFLNVSNIKINIDEDTPKILEQYATKKATNSLLASNPELALEWHPTKNGNLTPDKVHKGSRKKVWWRGKCGHEWLMSVADRTQEERTLKNGKVRKSYGCPYCSSKRILIGYNDLATTHPQLAKEWHPTKNGNLTPKDIQSGSSKKVWWRCEKGHEWEASPNSRKRGDSCPYCRGKRAVNGVNDLATLFPRLVEEWDWNKNKKMKPNSLTRGSDKKVWWICSVCGFNWCARIKDRTDGSGCPNCRKKENENKFIEKVNKNIHYKNSEFTITGSYKGLNSPISCNCPIHGEWETNAINLTKGLGCPICCGHVETE